MRRWLAFLLLPSFVLAKNPTPQKLTVMTTDDVALEAIWFAPEHSPKSGWLLMHGLGSVKEEWMSLVPQILAGEQAVCLVDLRGHGQSVRRRDGSPIDYRQFRDSGPKSEWSKMVKDVDRILADFSKASGIPRGRLGVGGASLGANIALNAAAEAADIPALVLLSPGLEYAGIGSEAAFDRFGKKPVFMAASPGDGYAFATVQQLARHRQDPALRVMVGDGSAHGVQMFNASFNQTLIAWMKTVLSDKK